MKNICSFIDGEISYFYEFKFSNGLSDEIILLDECLGDSVVDNIWDNTWHIIQFEILDSLCLIKNDFKENIINAIKNEKLKQTY